MADNDKQLGELIGTLKTFMADEKEARARTDATIEKLTAAMKVTTDDLAKQIEEVHSQAKGAHRRINNLYLGGKIVGITLGGVGGFVAWLWMHGKAAVDATEKLINHH